ncbi:MAG: peptidyl-prolyl cis-trans isomerase, partial [Candidatus Eisenbacteria bacterium]
MRKSVFLLVLCLVLAPLISGTSFGQKDAKQKKSSKTQEDPRKRVLATVGGVPITQQEFEVQFRAGIERMQESNRRFFASPHGRRQFLEMLVDTKVWMLEAARAGYDKDEDVEFATRLYKEQAMVRTFYEKEMVSKAAPSESEALEYYNANVNRFREPDTVWARQIVVKDSADAKRLIDDLNAGGDFEKLARERSIDRLTADKGGFLGRLVQGVALPPSCGGSPEYARMLFTLEPGAPSDPVNTEKGYHVVKLDDKRQGQARPYEHVKKRIVDGFTNERINAVKK